MLGHKDVPGKPALYGTTKEFLDYFNLKSLEDLPSLAEIKDLDQFHPELAFSEEQFASSDEDDEASADEAVMAEADESGTDGPDAQDSSLTTA